MLEAQSLTKYYNHRGVVENVSFHIRSHDIVGYLGPNGAGKSACYGYAAASLESWLLADIHRFLCFHILAVAALLVWIHHRGFSVKAFLRFEEESQAAPVYLDLRN
jgi:hypothetical protein